MICSLKYAYLRSISARNKGSKRIKIQKDPSLPSFWGEADMMQISAGVTAAYELCRYNPNTMAGILEHTSDVAIWTEGFSKKELYANALWQMSDVLLPGHCQEIAHYDCLMRVRIHAGDATALLIDFLSEALALTYIQKAIFCYAYFDVLSDTALSARLYGRWYDHLANEIKAVTYHEANINREHGGKWATPVLFDLHG